MSKYKTGDRVRVKDLRDYEDRGPGITDGMLRMAGEVYEITCEYSYMTFASFAWRDEWVELVGKHTKDDLLKLNK